MYYAAIRDHRWRHGYRSVDVCGYAEACETVADDLTCDGYRVVSIYAVREA